MPRFDPVVGIDVGTTSVTAAVYDRDAGRAVPVLDPATGAAEFPAAVTRDRHGRRTPVADHALDLLLAMVKRLAEAQTGGPVRDAVLVTPTHLTSAARAELEAAARRVGLNPLALVPGAVAVVAAYADDRPESKRRTVLVYDFGGTAFEAAVVRIDGDRAEVLAFSGEPTLGADIDAHIAEWAAALAPGHGGRVHLLAEAERAKRLLSQGRPATITLFPDRTDGPSVELTPAKFGLLVEPFVERTLRHVERAVEEAGVKPSDLDAVLLAGGSAQLPLVRAALGRHFGRAAGFVRADHPPAQVAALGAAVLARRIAASTVTAPLDSPAPAFPSAVPAPPAAPSLPDAPPPPPVPRLDEVQFTVYRPKAVGAGAWYPLLAFAHLADRRPDAPPSEPDPVERVRAEAARVLGPRARGYRDTTADARRPVPTEGELTFVPLMPGVEFNPPRRTFRWTEDVHREEFRLRAGPDLAGQTARGTLSVYLGVFLIAEVDLGIRVEAAGAAPAAPAFAEPEPVRPYRKIFASYSHRDAEVVRQYERFAGALGDRYLRDVRDLRAGEHWDDALLRLIAEADVFQLFWSSNAMGSAFVRREWEYALGLGREAFVRPTYWEDPLPESPADGLPPEALRRLHFHRLGLPDPPRPPAPAPPAADVGAEDPTGTNGYESAPARPPRTGSSRPDDSGVVAYAPADYYRPPPARSAAPPAPRPAPAPRPESFRRPPSRSAPAARGGRTELACCLVSGLATGLIVLLLTAWYFLRPE